MSARRPVRQCVACRARRSKDELLRISLGESGPELTTGTTYRPGRGAYICATGSCLDSLRRKGFRDPRAGLRVTANEMKDCIDGLDPGFDREAER